MRQPTGFYPRVRVGAEGFGVVSQAGAVVLVETVRRLGLDRELAAALARWRKPTAVHDPGKVVCDLAIAVALGGDCLADVGLLRAEPSVFGPVASDPTVSRMVDVLAADADRVLAAIDTARASVRAKVWSAAGDQAPDHEADALIGVRAGTFVSRRRAGRGGAMKKEDVRISAGVIMKVDVGSTETCSALAEVNDLHDRVDAALRQVGEVVEGPPIDVALRREGEASTPTRDLIFAYDGLLADLSRHLVGMEVAVCPLVAQRLPDGTRTVRGYLVRARQMETTMRHIERLLWGDAQAPSRRLDLLHQELLEQMAQHREDEARMLATLESMLTPEQHAALAAQLELATRKAPTRPHPGAVRRLSWTRMLYRPVAGFDRLLDTLSSRGVPRLGTEPRRRRVGLWGSYLLGLPPEHSADDAVAAPAPSPRLHGTEE